ncbi:MAG: hypothetical protein Q7S15_00070 [bacterium]|nr:hypothetical protein [bacterium]
MKKASCIFAMLFMVSLMLGAEGGCEEASNQQSASGAMQAKVISVPLNSKGQTCEQQNVQDRIRITTDPTKVMWIHMIALDGKIVRRMPVRNKVTSSGKRLEPSKAAGTYISSSTSSSLPRYNEWTTDELLGPDGTYGGSDNYIYWFDPMGRYHQWGTAGGLGYLVTDYPIDLENPMDQITGLYNANQAATAWQKQQEVELKKQEGK